MAQYVYNVTDLRKQFVRTRAGKQLNHVPLQSVKYWIFNHPKFRGHDGIYIRKFNG